MAFLFLDTPLNCPDVLAVFISLAGDILAESCRAGHRVHQLREWNMFILRPKLHPVDWCECVLV